MRGFPAGPLASVSTVSLGLVCSSTLMRLKLPSAASRSAVASDGAVIAQSVTVNTSMVAMLGAIIPLPLAMPASDTVRPPSRTRRNADLVARSVVTIAAAAAASAFGPRARRALRALMPRTTRGVGSNRPMTPVELTRTSRGEQPTASATARHIASASRTPRAPVAELLMPLLHTIARATPAVARRCRLLTITGAPTTRFVVKTPAAAHGTSATISARSGLPDGLIPQTPPAAVKPRQRVIDPLCAMSRARMVGPRAPSCTPNDHGKLAAQRDRINRVLRVILHTRWSSEVLGSDPAREFRRAVTLRSQVRHAARALADDST